MSEVLISVVSPWLVTIMLVIQLGAGAVMSGKIARFGLKMSKVGKILLLAAVVGGGLIRWYWTPEVHRIYFDEDRYLSYAVSFAKFGKQVGIDAATQTEIIKGSPDLVARVTVPTINAWVMKLSGYSEYHLIHFAKLVSTCQILLVFAAAYLLFKKEFPAVAAAGIFAFMPMNVFWAPTIALDAYFVTFSLVAFIAACWYARDASLMSAALLIASTVNLLFVRFEAMLFLAVLGATIMIIRQAENIPVVAKKDWGWMALALPIIGVRVLVSLAVLGQTWCCGEATPLEVFSLGYVVRNTIPNLTALFGDGRTPAVVAFLAMAALLGRKDRKIVILAVWLAAYFLIYSLYYAGMFFTYTFSGSNGRYLLMILPPLAILAGLTIEAIIRMEKKAVKLGLGLVIGWGCINTVWYYRPMVYVSPYDQIVDAPVRKSHEFLEYTMLPRTEPGAVVIHPLTAMVVMHERTGVYFASFLDDEVLINLVKNKLQQGVPAYMWQTHTCDFTPAKCEKILPVFDFVPVEIDPKDNPWGYEMVRLQLRAKR